MQKTYEKTGSSTQKLSVINGMYPQISCNHRMRATNHQFNELVAKEKAEKAKINRSWKQEREAKKFFKVVGEVFSTKLMELIDQKHQPIQQWQGKRSISSISIEEVLKHKDLETFNALKSMTY